MISADDHGNPKSEKRCGSASTLYQIRGGGDAFNAKLAPKFIGPLEVRKVPSPVIVDLRDEKGKWYRHVHVRDLKPTAPEYNNKEGHTEDNEAGQSKNLDRSDTPEEGED